MLGNPGTDPSFDDNSKVSFAHRMALIPDEMFKVAIICSPLEFRTIFHLLVNLQRPGSQSAKRSCRGDYLTQNGQDPRCLEDIQVISKVDDNY